MRPNQDGFGFSDGPIELYGIAWAAASERRVLSLVASQTASIILHEA